MHRLVYMRIHWNAKQTTLAWHSLHHCHRQRDDMSGPYRLPIWMVCSAEGAKCVRQRHVSHIQPNAREEDTHWMCVLSALASWLCIRLRELECWMIRCYLFSAGVRIQNSFSFFFLLIHDCFCCCCCSFNSPRIVLPSHRDGPILNPPTHQ